ncbi:MAG: archease [Desulfobacteraceae bacterium]|jgi:SHS2 domain-containing protein
MSTKSTFYSLFNHTADLGMSVKGHSCEDLFRNAGTALLELLVDNKAPETGKKLEVSLDGNDLPDLMVKWLSEILYLFEGESLIVTEISINSLNSSNITSTLSVIEFDGRYHAVLREIKAVTYHQIEVKEKNGLWTARVIFDL